MFFFLLHTGEDCKQASSFSVMFVIGLDQRQANTRSLSKKNVINLN